MASTEELAEREAAVADELDAELAGLDALDLAPAPAASLARRSWRAAWPKLSALVVGVAVWQLVYETGWRPPWVLPAPATVAGRLWADLGDAETWRAVANTMRRAVVGFGLSVVAGSLLGVAVSSWRPLRAAIGSLLTGLQTMPSIAWFPLAILLFRLSEQAILFVVVLGAAPSVANGLISGIDHVPVLWRRAARALGASGVTAYRHVILPAALPGFVAGLKQGWAFAWRSLMAGELLVVIADQPSIGARLQFAREFADAVGLLSVMATVILIGIVIDAVGFGALERGIRRRRGLERT